MNRGGFSIIELMVVIGIVGILAVVAIPVYQNYAVRARVIEGITLSSGAQIAVLDAVSQTGGLPGSQADTSYQTPAATDNVASIVIADDGSGDVIITYTDVAGGGSIIFQPTLDANKNVTWSCTGGTLEDRFRPVTCR